MGEFDLTDSSNSQDQICYKKNYLTEVIARVDFLSKIDTINKTLPKQVSDIVLENFPIAEPRESISTELQVTPKGETLKASKAREWPFHGKNRDKTLTITADAIFVKYTTFENYAKLRQEFLSITSEMCNVFSEIQVRRLGLRYINNIDLDPGDVFNWSDYLHPSLLRVFEFYHEKKMLSRVFHNLELKLDEYSVSFRFGMHNPDYPASIKKKVFVLDLDAYSQGHQGPDEIPDSLDTYHAKIQELFEHSITDKLRAIMNT